MYDYIVVGAGIAGLSLSYQLAKNKKSVLLIERNKHVGGLARSFCYEFNRQPFIFDIGPKRFHTEDKAALAFILEILGNEYIKTGRKSSVYLFGKYFNWPITTTDLFKLPPTIQLKIGIDLIKKVLPSQTELKSNRFDSYIIHKYGPTLFKHFFKNYTEKFLLASTGNIHADWASTGINRSIIDKKAKGNSITELAKGILIPKPVKTTFIYPSQKGFGYFSLRLKEQIEKNRGNILTNLQINRIDYPHSTVETKQGTYRFGQLIWTGNINDLSALLGINATGLGYLSTIFYNCVVTGSAKRSDQWIYYGDPRLKMVRVSLGCNFAPYLAPPNYHTIIVEKTCLFKDQTWNSPATLLENIAQELAQVKLIDNPKQIKQVFIASSFSICSFKLFSTISLLFPRTSNIRDTVIHPLLSISFTFASVS